MESVHADAASYEFPVGIKGIISTFALTLVPDYDQVICRGASALAPGGRWVIVDFKLSVGWAVRLTPLLEPLVRPFGVTLDMAGRHPWESMQKYLKNFTIEEFFLGFTYIAVGEAICDIVPPKSSPALDLRHAAFSATATGPSVLEKGSGKL